MKGKQESMDSKLIAMKQYVCGEGVAENAGEFAHDFFPEHIIFKTLSERRLAAACLLSVPASICLKSIAWALRGFLLRARRGWWRGLLNTIKTH